MKRAQIPGALSASSSSSTVVSQVPSPLTALSSKVPATIRVEESKEEGYVLTSPDPAARDREFEEIRRVPSGVYRRGQPVRPTLAGARRLRRGMSSLPAEINLTPHFHHVFRFNCTTTTSATVSVIQLFGALGGICSAANSAVSTWTSSVRVKKITIWPAAPSASAAGAYIDWFFSDTSLFPDESKSVTYPEGVTVTAPLVFVPPEKSLCGMWINSTATSTFNLFNISVVAGSVIDVAVECTLGLVNSTSSSLYQLTVTTGTLGNVYYLALDGPSNNKIPPVSGIPTTH